MRARVKETEREMENKSLFRFFAFFVNSFSFLFLSLSQGLPALSLARSLFSLSLAHSFIQSVLCSLSQPYSQAAAVVVVAVVRRAAASSPSAPDERLR